MTLAVRDSGDLSMTFRDLKSFGARLSDLNRTLAGDPETRVSDLKFTTSNDELPVVLRYAPNETEGQTEGRRRAGKGNETGKASGKGEERERKKRRKTEDEQMGRNTKPNAHPANSSGLGFQWSGTTPVIMNISF